MGPHGQPGMGQQPQGLGLDLVCDFSQLTDELKTRIFLSLYGQDGATQTQSRDAQRLVQDSRPNRAPRARHMSAQHLPPLVTTIEQASQGAWVPPHRGRGVSQPRQCRWSLF